MDRRTVLTALAGSTLTLGMSARGESASAKSAEKGRAAGPITDYTPQPFAFPNGLPGLSKELLADHLSLYKGYVGRTNTLLNKMMEAEKAELSTPEVQELRRRLGFEFSGMRLHELYFSALGPKAQAPNPKHPLQQRIAQQWGSWDKWWAGFKSTCLMPGIGWAALVRDPLTDRLMNAWLQNHEDDALWGTDVLLLIDVWEHAYAPDYRPTGRGKYVDAVKPLIQWQVVEKRFKA